MKNLIFVLSLLPVAANAVSEKKCSELLNAGLNASERFVLIASRKIFTDGHLPHAATAAQAIRRKESSLDADKEPPTLAEILKGLKLTTEEWASIEDVEFKNPILGTDEFVKGLSERPKTKKLDPAQVAAFTKLNVKAEEAREKIKTLLSAAEQLSFSQNKRLLTEAELVESLRQFSRDPKLGLSYLGVQTLEEWRYVLFTEREPLKKEIERTLMSALVKATTRISEIPEGADETLEIVAGELGVAKAELASFVGDKKIFKDINQFIEAAVTKHAASFTKVIDRRYFSEERRARMIEAMRKANDIVVFKLAENQDLKNFEAIKRLAASLNAPIVVAPTFASIGLIPKQLDWLFKEPNVHFMVDQGVQITDDFYLVDHGFEDKRQNPLVGLAEIYQPTDRVVAFHPKVRSLTRPTGTYDIQPGYLMTTGSMSDPAYQGKFNISMSTDDRAQREAEKNRSVVVLSRRYQDPKFGALLSNANGIAPRRVRFTEPMFGNPAGLFDLGKIYGDEGVTDVKFIAALDLGDLHLPITDPKFLQATSEAMESLKLIERNPSFGKTMEPEFRQGPVKLGAIVLHDLVNGDPNNGHTIDSLITRAIDDEKGELDLDSHFRNAAGWLKQQTLLMPDTLVIIPSDNHGHDWLMKRLQKGDFFKGRPKDTVILLELMLAAIKEGANPYERIFQHYGVNMDQVRFMSKADTFRVGIDMENPTRFQVLHGVEVGQHSQYGVHGSKSISLGKLLAAYGPNATGHTHSTAEYGQSMKVGTGTPVRQGYHAGPSSSDMSIGVIYNEHASQLLRLTKGRFIPDAPDQAPEAFFPSAQYPMPLIRQKPPGGPTTDQFRASPPKETGGRRR